jgi:hypothetical protein
VSRLIAVLALVCATQAAGHANTVVLPAALKAEQGDLRVLGQGKMRWYGLLLYDAALWVPGSEWQWDRTFALDIRYARNFAGEKLAAASVDEMMRLGYRDARKLSAWREHMLGAFPDVKSGERIVGVYRPGVGAEFFHEGRSTAAIADPEFARAFFSIWLDPGTREPKLRAALLGQR